MENNKPLTKKRKAWRKVGLVGSIVVLVLAISICSIVLFQRFYYTPFWVNGQSMYPTLNKDAKYKDGTLVGKYRSGSLDGEYDVDYGFMDANSSAIDKINRFQIIIFKASESMVSYNIKRVIVMPGETFYITMSDQVEENGNLYVLNNSTNAYELIDQPISSEILHNGAYTVKYSTPTTLTNDEYFVMGDNRELDYSFDSRVTGPITKDLILGVAVGINGRATLGYKGETIVPVSINHFWPRFL